MILIKKKFEKLPVPVFVRFQKFFFRFSVPVYGRYTDTGYYFLNVYNITEQFTNRVEYI